MGQKGARAQAAQLRRAGVCVGRPGQVGRGWRAGTSAAIGCLCEAGAQNSPGHAESGGRSLNHLGSVLVPQRGSESCQVHKGHRFSLEGDPAALGSGLEVTGQWGGSRRMHGIKGWVWLGPLACKLWCRSE